MPPDGPRKRRERRHSTRQQRFVADWEQAIALAVSQRFVASSEQPFAGLGRQRGIDNMRTAACTRLDPQSAKEIAAWQLGFAPRPERWKQTQQR